MHPEIEKLVNLVQDASDLLLAHGEKSWGEWLRLDAQRIRNLDFYGVEHMLSAFGGVGGINDLVLSRMNGHNIEESEVAKMNEEIQRLLESIFKIAKKLEKEESITTRNT